MRRLPRHVALIMDGNGRWAQARGYPRVFGHVRGSSRIRPLVREANRLGIQAMTFYAFSTENWARPDSELQVLWKLLIKYVRKEIEELDSQNVCLRIIGQMDRLAPNVREVLESAMERLKGNTGLALNFAISYGSRTEITEATREIALKVQAGELALSDITEDCITSHLWTRELGSLSDVDLMIRTSGEIRISNFMLWQAAYAEFVFREENWPDFGVKQFQEALEDYSERDRRFGGTTKSGGQN